MVGDLTFGIAVHHGLLFGVANAVEATLFVLVGASIAAGRNRVGLLSVRGAWAVVIAAVTAPALTGGLGAFGTVLAFGAGHMQAWAHWWFGDSLGLLLGVPICLLLRDSRRSVARQRGAALSLSVGTASALLSALSGLFTIEGVVGV
ncbi:MAG: hypothetical protein AB7G47_10295 [Mycolicibacterium sp.]